MFRFSQTQDRRVHEVSCTASTDYNPIEQSRTQPMTEVSNNPKPNIFFWRSAEVGVKPNSLWFIVREPDTSRRSGERKHFGAVRLFFGSIRFAKR
jgi:hypothetical protein